MRRTESIERISAEENIFWKFAFVFNELYLLKEAEKIYEIKGYLVLDLSAEIFLCFISLFNFKLCDTLLQELNKENLFHFESNPISASNIDTE